MTPILESFRQALIAERRIDTRALEAELCAALGTGYRGLKEFMNDLCKHQDHFHVAIYYMQNSNAPGPVTEFHRALADAYGIEDYYSDDREESQNSFWHNFFDANS